MTCGYFPETGVQYHTTTKSLIWGYSEVYVCIYIYIYIYAYICIYGNFRKELICLVLPLVFLEKVKFESLVPIGELVAFHVPIFSDRMSIQTMQVLVSLTSLLVWASSNITAMENGWKLPLYTWFTCEHTGNSKHDLRNYHLRNPAGDSCPFA